MTVKIKLYRAKIQCLSSEWFRDEEEARNYYIDLEIKMPGSNHHAVIFKGFDENFVQEDLSELELSPSLRHLNTINSYYHTRNRGHTIADKITEEEISEILKNEFQCK